MLKKKKELNVSQHTTPKKTQWNNSTFNFSILSKSVLVALLLWEIGWLKKTLSN